MTRKKETEKVIVNSTFVEQIFLTKYGHTVRSIKKEDGKYCVKLIKDKHGNIIKDGKYYWIAEDLLKPKDGDLNERVDQAVKTKQTS